VIFCGSSKSYFRLFIQHILRNCKPKFTDFLKCFRKVSEIQTARSQPRTSCLNFQYCVDFRDVLNCWWIQLVLYRSVMPRAYWTCRTGRAAGEIGKFWGSVWDVFVYVCMFLRNRKRFRWLIGWPGWLHVYSSFEIPSYSGAVHEPRSMGLLNFKKPFCAFLIVLWNPSAHFALCGLLRRFCIHQEFVICLSAYLPANILLINTCSDPICVGTSVHCWKRPRSFLSGLAWALSHVAFSRTDCRHWNAVEFNLNSTWINEEVEWQSVISFGGKIFLHCTPGIVVSYAILLLCAK